MSTLQPPLFNITPNAKGMSAHGDNPDHTYTAIHPLIDEDLKHESTIEFETFLSRYLPASRFEEHTARVDRIFALDAVHSKCREFRDTGSPETLSYKPFVALGNEILANSNPLGSSPLKFYVQDAKYVQGSIAARKPDVVLVQSNPSSVGAFCWDDIFCCVEFKGNPVDRKDKKRLTVLKGKGSGSKSGSHSTSQSSPSSHSASQTNSPSRSTSASQCIPQLIHSPGGTSKSSSKNYKNSKKRPASNDPVAESIPKVPRISEDPATKDERKQSAGYALEMMSHGRVRSHVINLTIDGAWFRIWYYHRSGILLTKSIDLKTNDGLKYFIDALIRMSYFTLEQWGFHPFIDYAAEPFVPARTTSGIRHQPSRSSKEIPQNRYNEADANDRDTVSPDRFTGSIITVNNTRIILGKVVTRQYMLIGRGTIVVEGRYEDKALADDDLMVKISWPSIDRASEVDIIEYARTNHNSAILDHIPTVLHSQDFNTTGRSPRNNGTRILRVIVMPRFQPVERITSFDDYVKVMIDVVQCG